MSLEEDITVDSFGTLKKAKRSRQRVDAGEPRNSYSSIPNFSSRPNLFNNNIYNTLFAAQNHIAAANQYYLPSHTSNKAAKATFPSGTNLYYPQGTYPSTKMLNVLLSHQVKTIDNISSRETTMMPLDLAGNDISATISSNAYATDCITTSQSPVTRVLSNTINGGGSASNNRGAPSPPVGDMAQHMLRNILQGVGRSKKDLYALEQELQAATNNNELGVECANDTNILNNNNITNINNNNEMKLMDCISNKTGYDDENEEENDSEHDSITENLANGNLEDMDTEDSKETQLSSQQYNVDKMSQIAKITDDDDKLNHISDSSSSEKSVSSPIKSDLSTKEDTDDTSKDYNDDNFIRNGSVCQPISMEQAELKRARVENIVSGMHSNPLPPINGCKKRKLYHPQQHDNSNAEHYTSFHNIVNQLTDDEDETKCSAEVRTKVVEKNALKNQLRMMQEQMAHIAQKYAQLRNYQSSSVEDGDEEKEEISSDIEQDDHSICSPEPKIQSQSPTSTSISTPTTVLQKEHTTAVFPPDTVVPPAIPKSSNVDKMLNLKFLHQNTNLQQLHFSPPNYQNVHPNFNGALSFLQHQIIQDQKQFGAIQGHLPHHHHPHQHYPAFTNAAAMYHKLFMEQEACVAKEAVLAAAAAAATTTAVEYPSQNSSIVSQLPQSANHYLNNHKAFPLSIRSKHNNIHTSGSTSSSRIRVGNPSVDQLHTNKSKVSANNSTKDNNFDLEGLADALKSEITSTLSNLIDTIVHRFIQQKQISSKSSIEAALAAEQLNKDLLLASQLLDCKSPRTKIIDRGNCNNSSLEKQNSNSSSCISTSTKLDGSLHSSSSNLQHTDNSNAINLSSVKSTSSATSFPHAPKITAAVAAAAMNNSATTAALYSTINGLGNSHTNLFEGLPDTQGDTSTTTPEQNEALSLVVGPTKKKRSKVTDTRITPRTVSRILAQDGINCPPGPLPLLPPASLIDLPSKFGNILPSINNNAESPPLPRSFHIPHPTTMLPVSLPTSVAIPNPGLHESQIFSQYNPYYGHNQGLQLPPVSSPPNRDHLHDSPPISHHSSLFHPALLAAAQQQQQQSQSQSQHQRRASLSPDFINGRPNSGLGGESTGAGSDCNSMDYEGMTPTSSTLSPMHLRKAKLMFFWVRYPTSAVLKMYFPDIRFNKNNTAQLVKWFSNFREFYYIQMEKYARAEIANGTKNPDDLHVSIESDIYRVLNLHYNRNNHIEVPPNFRYVVEQTLKEFFKAIQIGKDQDQSWKKPIYKVIGRLDDQVPEYFKSPNFLEQLE